MLLLLLVRRVVLVAGFPFTLTILYIDLDGVPGLREVAEPVGHKGQYIIILKNFFKRKKIIFSDNWD